VVHRPADDRHRLPHAVDLVAHLPGDDPHRPRHEVDSVVHRPADDRPHPGREAALHRCVGGRDHRPVRSRRPREAACRCFARRREEVHPPEALLRPLSPCRAVPLVAAADHHPAEVGHPVVMVAPHLVAVALHVVDVVRPRPHEEDYRAEVEEDHRVADEEDRRVEAEGDRRVEAEGDRHAEDVAAVECTAEVLRSPPATTERHPAFPSRAATSRRKHFVFQERLHFFLSNHQRRLRQHTSSQRKPGATQLAASKQHTQPVICIQSLAT
jgi:hypothetical protein